MDERTKVTLAAAVAAGYVLGRTRKGRLALTAVTYLAGRRFGLEPRQLVAEGVRRLGQVPQVAELQEQLRTEGLEAARNALTAVAGRNLGSLADAISERTLGLGAKGEEPEDEYEEEPEAEDEYEEEPEEEYEEEEEEEDEEEPEEEAPPRHRRRGARESTRPASSGQRKSVGAAQKSASAGRDRARKAATSKRAASAEKAAAPAKKAAPVKKAAPAKRAAPAKKAVAKKAATKPHTRADRRR
ncbi:histone protein [Streptomyces sp. NPDC102264]|uniref:histone protein n=1 Tax=Streptomyces sp. NPDC102264 TaxID=3366149 RepID=UPI00380855D5